MVVQRRTVLIVDDNDGLREVLAGVLRDEGIETHEAATGGEALRLLAEVQFDLAVLDLNLPDTTGVAIYARVIETHRSLPCIFMTAEAEAGLIDEALRLEPFRLLRKPFEVSLFRDLVRRAISGEG